MTPSPHPTLLSVRATNAYGLFVARVRLPSGAEVDGWGLTPQQAEWKARARAKEMN